METKADVYMNNRKKTNILAAAALLCNLLTVAMVAQSVLHFFSRSGEGNMTAVGAGCFIYFTIDSNILAALFCLIALPFNVINLIRGEMRYPLWLKIGYFAGTVAVSVTFWTVILFLGPILGYSILYVGVNLPLHLICPLLVFFTCVLFQNSKEFRLSIADVGILPTLIYGTVYFYQVILTGAGNGGWEDFYHFNDGGLWYISILAMLAATYLLCLGVYFAHRLCGRLLLKKPA